MSKDILDKFNKLLREIEGNPNPNVEKFVHEALMLLTRLREKIMEGSAQEKQEALDATRQIQQALEKKAQQAFQATGMNAADLEKFLGQKSNFTDEQWQMFQKAQKEMVDYQKSLTHLGSDKDHDHHEGHGPGKGSHKKGHHSDDKGGSEGGKRVRFRA